MKPLTKSILIILSIMALGIIIYVFLCADTESLRRIDGISTVVLSLLTASYVILTYQILKSSRHQPHVFVNLPTDDTDFDLYLSIKNIGNRPAYDVVITIEPSLDILAPADAYKGASEPMLKQPFMAPESEIKNLISNSVKIHSLSEDKKRFNIQLRYKDSQGHKYSDAYRINIGSYLFEKKFHASKKI
jgi:hypothetical protein